MFSLLFLLLVPLLVVGQSSTTEPDFFDCTREGDLPGAEFILSEGRCVRKHPAPPTIVPGIPDRIPLLTLTLPLMRDSDSADKHSRRDFLTVSTVRPGKTEYSKKKPESKVSLEFDFSVVPTDCTIYESFLNMSASYWDGSEENTVTLGVNLTTNVNSKTEVVVNNTPEALIVFESPFALTARSNLTTIVRTQQNFLDIYRPRPKYTLHEAKTLRLDVGWKETSLDATYIKLISSRLGHREVAQWPSAQIMYSAEKWYSVQPRTLEMNRSTTYTVTGRFDFHEMYQCGLSSKYATLLGPLMHPESVSTLLCQVPNVSNAMRVCNESSSQSVNNWKVCYDTFSFHVYRVWKRYVPVANTADSIEIADIHVPIYYTGHVNEAKVMVTPTTRKRPVEWNTQADRGGEAVWNGPSDQHFGKRYMPNDNR